MDILGLGSKVEADFLLDPQGQRKQTEVKIDDNKRQLQYIYYDGEDVNGMVENPIKVSFLISDLFRYKLN